MQSSDKSGICIYCGKQLSKDSSVCPHCGNENRADSRFPVIYNGKKGKWRKDKDHCSKCKQKYMEESDKYCRFCGTKRRDVYVRYFQASPGSFDVLYGPRPAVLQYHCSNCGKKWKYDNWHVQHYCPRCGHEVEYKKKDYRNFTKTESGYRYNMKGFFRDIRTTVFGQKKKNSR